MTGIEITRADVNRLDEVAGLFDQYRVFYGQVGDYAAARRFMEERFESDDSVVFLATMEGSPVGFTQLYPSLSSVAMQRIWILNDLYVAHDARRQGVARGLLQAAEAFARRSLAVRLVLATAVDNHTAKSLYESSGWIKDNEFDQYTLPLA